MDEQTRAMVGLIRGLRTDLDDLQGALRTRAITHRVVVAALLRAGLVTEAELGRGQLDTGGDDR